MCDDRTAGAMGNDVEMRLRHLEAAYIDLLERVIVIERSLRFEANARADQDKTIARLAGLPLRVERLEETARILRRSHVLPPEGAV